MRFVVFLDIDGVLNTRTTVKRTPYGYTGIDDATEIVEQIKNARQKLIDVIKKDDFFCSERSISNAIRLNDNKARYIYSMQIIHAKVCSCAAGSL